MGTAQTNVANVANVTPITSIFTDPLPDPIKNRLKYRYTWFNADVAYFDFHFVSELIRLSFISVTPGTDVKIQMPVYSTAKLLEYQRIHDSTYLYSKCLQNSNSIFFKYRGLQHSDYFESKKLSGGISDRIDDGLYVYNRMREISTRADWDKGWAFNVQSQLTTVQKIIYRCGLVYNFQVPWFLCIVMQAPRLRHWTLDYDFAHAAVQYNFYDLFHKQTFAKNYTIHVYLKILLESGNEFMAWRLCCPGAPLANYNFRCTSFDDKLLAIIKSYQLKRQLLLKNICCRDTLMIVVSFMFKPKR